MSTRTDQSGITADPHARDSTADETLPPDDLFFALKNERRRRVLHFLIENEPVVEMRDVAEQVAAWEHDTTVDALGSDERQRVYISLYQAHLPKLDSLGVIEYNQSRGIIEQTELMDRIVPYLRPDDAPGEAGGREANSFWVDRWERYFTTVTVMNMALVGAVGIGVLPYSSISSLLLPAVVVSVYVVLLLSMLAHQSRTRQLTPFASRD